MSGDLWLLEPFAIFQMKPHRALKIRAQLAESLSGIELLPGSRGKQSMSATLERLVRQLFHNRIPPFDDRATVQYSKAAAAEAAHCFTVAARDPAPFLAAGYRF